MVNGGRALDGDEGECELKIASEMISAGREARSSRRDDYGLSTIG